LIPLAQSIELPPPKPTSRSGRNSRATAVPASISSVVGFSPKPENNRVVMPAACRDSMPPRVCPAATIPGSLATSTRVAPSPRANSPSRTSAPRPTTSRVEPRNSKS
jgi:hypothetical protein